MCSGTMDSLPLVRREIVIGGRGWVVEAAEDQDALLSASEGRAQFPFGLMLWESAVALAGVLYERAAEVRGARVLELGCGIGLAGVIAAGLGARVVQTDHDPGALEAARRTARLNGVEGIETVAADWHDWRVAGTFDLIIGADVTYDAADHAAVLCVLERALAVGGRVLLADPGREAQAAFVARAEAAGWRVKWSERRVADLQRAGTEMAVAMLEMERR